MKHITVHCAGRLGLNCKASNGEVHMLIKELTRVV